MRAASGWHRAPSTFVDWLMKMVLSVGHRNKKRLSGILKDDRDLMNRISRTVSLELAPDRNAIIHVSIKRHHIYWVYKNGQGPCIYRNVKSKLFSSFLPPVARLSLLASY